MNVIDIKDPLETGRTEPEEGHSQIEQALDMPRRAGVELKRWFALPYIRLRFKIHGISWGHGWRVFGMPIIQRFRGSKIILGNQLDLRSWRTTNPLIPHHPVVFATRSREAVIRIGNQCGLTGTVIVAAEMVQLGDRVLVGANVT